MSTWPNWTDPSKAAGGERAGRNPWPQNRPGAVLVYAMLAMTVFVFFAAFAVDTARVRLAKTQLQFAADTAARAACQDLPSGYRTAQSTAVSMAAQNKVDGVPLTLKATSDISFGVWDPITRSFTVLNGAAQSNANAVKIVASRSGSSNGIPLSFGSVSGNNTSSIQISTIACLTGNAGAYSIIGMNGITMSGNAFTDSYNATKGAYSAATANHKGSIASNGNIVLSSFAKVDGDARCGVEKTTTLQNSATVTGLNAPLGTIMSYPSVTLPASYQDLGDVNMSSGTTSVPGGTYLLHHLTLSGTATINWTGPTVLYIRDSYTVTQSAAINTYQNLPSNRILYFLPTCTTATWSGTNVCVGELYAPDTDFTVSGNVELFGRILAKTINNSSSGGMHYDESMSPPGGTALRSSVSIVQ